MEVIARYGLLHKSIVTTRINWLPKSQNIQSIADELNINVESVAFFDDSSFERDEVSYQLPQVSVFSEEDISVAPEFPCFQIRGQLTQDAASRVERYKEDANRKQSQESFGSENFEEFLVTCEMRLEVRLAGRTELSRVAEIFQRTNQMNATLKRAQLTDVEEYFDTEGSEVHIVKLGDKFGDYGVIGAALTTVYGNELLVNELALSCRAMGRRVEDALLEEIIGFASERNLQKVSISVTRTDRNNQILETLGRCGFLDSKSGSQESQWERKVLDGGVDGRNFAHWFEYDEDIQELID